MRPWRLICPFPTWRTILQGIAADPFASVLRRQFVLKEVVASVLTLVLAGSLASKRLTAGSEVRICELQAFSFLRPPLFP